MFSTPFWHLSQSLQYTMDTRLGRKKTGKVAHTRVTKCQQTFYRTPSCKTHHQEGGPDAQTEKKVVNKKTVKGILSKGPNLVKRSMYRFVVVLKICRLVKEKCTCMHVELARNSLFGLYPLNFAFILEQVMLLLCDKCSKVC